MCIWSRHCSSMSMNLLRAFHSQESKPIALYDVYTRIWTRLAFFSLHILFLKKKWVFSVIWKYVLIIIIKNIRSLLCFMFWISVLGMKLLIKMLQRGLYWGEYRLILFYLRCVCCCSCVIFSTVIYVLVFLFFILFVLESKGRGDDNAYIN